ncbi:unnamed protein product, partial [Ectocarpus sp. 13 AM-2016]
RCFLVQPVRLYVKGVMLGFKRGLRNTYHHTSLIKIQASYLNGTDSISCYFLGVEDKEASNFYLGKRIAYIYK